MSINFAGATNLTISGTTTIASLDTNRVYTLTNRPYFWVTQSVSPTPIGSDIIFNAVGQNVGNHYNSTNGRFTAPVTGVYHFTYRQLSQNANPAGNYVPSTFVNGTAWLPGYDHKAIEYTWHSVSTQTVISLNANDYVTVRWVTAPAGATTYTDLNYAQFSGHLVG